ncbi:hypothetical protein IJ670_02945 [bacterium]|nr:hypothetical protein [bacterium]
MFLNSSNSSIASFAPYTVSLSILFSIGKFFLFSIFYFFN